ncbi:hypothetical protein K440DRAFT_643347 [Wilcoxina mikolae CBS 423.85]|nr:hypothetical protein K440DRAFT_643347 [Wilcoxina mikolae CBS 423.85]
MFLANIILFILFIGFIFDPIDFLLLGTMSYQPPDFHYHLRRSRRQRRIATVIRRYQRSMFAYHLEAKRAFLALIKAEVVPVARQEEPETTGGTHDGGEGSKDVSGPPPLVGEKEKTVPADSGYQSGGVTGSVETGWW